MDKRLFGNSLRHHRKHHKLTQEKFSELIGIDVRQVARIEAGESLPSLETLLKMAKILDITPNELLYNKEMSSTPETALKNDIYDILNFAPKDKLQLIKKLILAVIY